MSENGTFLIQGIVNFSRHFEFQVIAEGVETKAEHDAFRRIGSPFAQGYFYGKPMPSVSFRNK
jgi:c-di-GMP phosphodiesterase